MVHDGGWFHLGFGGIGGMVWWSTGDETKSGGGAVILPCTMSGRWSSGWLVAARQWRGVAARVSLSLSQIRAWELTYL
jgi:hypothetical protein